MENPKAKHFVLTYFCSQMCFKNCFCLYLLVIVRSQTYAIALGLLPQRPIQNVHDRSCTDSIPTAIPTSKWSIMF